MYIMLHRIKIAAAAALLLTLTGCSFGASIDTLMSPPKLSAEQEQIYNALTLAEGSSISLKYPKSGKYLSAFITEDIDNDGGSEAIVFYEKNGLAMEENALRINILDNEDGRWRSVGNGSANGTEIEQVMISQLGSNDRVNIIVGSSMLNRSEKSVNIYTYNGGQFDFKKFGSYSFFDVTDLDGCGDNEFLMLTGGSSDENARLKAYKLDSEGTFNSKSVDLSGGFTEFDKFSYGLLPDGSTGLYIDAVSGGGLIQTDIIRMDDTGLKKIFSAPEDASVTQRPAGWDSFDVDGDGMLEIPVRIIAPGYENVSESEQLWLTRWMYVNADEKLERRFGSYYSPGDRYVFLFPEKWRNKVTVSRDTLNDEIVFRAYNSATGESGRELMRIYVAEDIASREDRLSTGYMLLHTKGDQAYLAYIPQYTGNYDDDLSITAAEAAINFVVC